MPRADFKGVKLLLIGPMSVSISYPDVSSMETFLLMKEALDAIHQPKLVPKGETKPNG